MKISLTVTELWCVHECLEEINQRGIAWKLRKREKSFLCATHQPDLIHIPIKLHEECLQMDGQADGRMDSAKPCQFFSKWACKK